MARDLVVQPEVSAGTNEAALPAPRLHPTYVHALVLFCTV